MKLFVIKAVAIVALLVGMAPQVDAGDINRSQHISNRGAHKVDSAKAKRWLQDDQKSGYDRQSEQTIVNLGSRRAGTCTLNVGTTAPGQKAPKDVVVTAKDIINVCK